MTRTVKGLKGLQEIDFLTYGQPGQLDLSLSTVNDAVIHARASEIAVL